MKLLTICIPTYKRSKTLQRCIESVATQIDEYDLSTLVDIYVANDASPDDTLDVLKGFDSLTYFNSISRKTNLGMNVNIQNMLSEVKEKSKYQLIITDDDYLQPDSLSETVEFLKDENNKIKDIAAIWTPRYSYTDDGDLHTVVCNPFNKNMFVKPSVSHVGKYMNNGFVLSGLIIRAKYIDYDFWEKYKENAYFPVIFFADLLLQNGAYYWNKNLVYHTVLNECHWERWGETELLIELRLFSDYLNAYSITVNKTNKPLMVIPFYFYALSNIYSIVKSFMLSENLNIDRSSLLKIIKKQKHKGCLEFSTLMLLIMLSSLFLCVLISYFKIMVTRIQLFITNNKNMMMHYQKRISLNAGLLSTSPVMFVLIKALLFK